LLAGSERGGSEGCTHWSSFHYWRQCGGDKGLSTWQHDSGSAWEIIAAQTLMTWAIISAVNDEEVVRSCLLNSPGITGATPIIQKRGCSSAAEAYNTAIEESQADFLVFVHQDMYFPEGWIQRVGQAIEIINRTDRNWGVVGVWGVDENGESKGHVFCTASMRLLGQGWEGGREVVALDEIVLILRKSSGLRFDEELGGFHMYGADICLEAARRGMKCYAISAFCVHNSNTYRLFPFAFWKGYMKMRRKWRFHLPVCTTCIEITKWCWPMIRWNIIRTINLATGRNNVIRKRVADPSKFCSLLGECQ
jgi:hypothetical protein